MQDDLSHVGDSPCQELFDQAARLTMIIRSVVSGDIWLYLSATVIRLCTSSGNICQLARKSWTIQSLSSETIIQIPDGRYRRPRFWISEQIFDGQLLLLHRYIKQNFQGIRQFSALMENQGMARSRWFSSSRASREAACELDTLQARHFLVHSIIRTRFCAAIDYEIICAKWRCRASNNSVYS